MSETTDNLRDLNTPDKIAEAGERLYADRHKETLEREHMGKFVAIDLVTGEAYVDPRPEEAMKKARAAAPQALIHLIRIGSPGAFKVSYAARPVDWWPLRSSG